MSTPDSITVSLDWAKKIKEAEEWRAIKGYEGLYEVSNDGRVRRVQQCLKPAYTRGYAHVSLCKEGKIKTLRITRLVAETFIENPENKAQVNHKDGNPKNDSVENLEWATPSENTQHAVDTGLRARVQGVALESMNGRPPWNKGKKTGQIPWNKKSSIDESRVSDKHGQWLFVPKKQETYENPLPSQ